MNANLHVDVKTVAYATKTHNNVLVLQGGLETFAQIDVNQVVTELIVHKFASALMEQVAITSRVRFETIFLELK